MVMAGTLESWEGQREVAWLCCAVRGRRKTNYESLPCFVAEKRDENEKNPIIGISFFFGLLSEFTFFSNSNIKLLRSLFVLCTNSRYNFNQMNGKKLSLSTDVSYHVNSS